MSDLTTAFEAAAAAAKSLDERPSNAALLKMYAWYKQATVGDNVEPKPGFSDPVAWAKWDAWAQCKGMGRDAAMQAYIDLVAELP